MRFIEPNRLMATGTSNPVGRSKSRPGPPPGDFDARSVTAADLEIGAHRLGDSGQLALFVEGGDEVIQIFEHVLVLTGSHDHWPRLCRAERRSLATRSAAMRCCTAINIVCTFANFARLGQQLRR